MEAVNAVFLSPLIEQHYVCGVIFSKQFHKILRKGLCTPPTSAIFAAPPPNGLLKTFRLGAQPQQYGRQHYERKIQTCFDLRIKVASNSFGDWSLSILFCDQ
jgi:hypothetical protein